MLDSCCRGTHLCSNAYFFFVAVALGRSSGWETPCSGDRVWKPLLSDGLRLCVFGGRALPLALQGFSKGENNSPTNFRGPSAFLVISIEPTLYRTFTGHPASCRARLYSSFCFLLMPPCKARGNITVYSHRDWDCETVRGGSWIMQERSGREAEADVNSGFLPPSLDESSRPISASTAYALLCIMWSLTEL